MGHAPWSIVVADFDGDGKPDLAIANGSGLDVSVLINLGNGTFTAAVSYPVGGTAVSVAAADFNGDGKPDLAVADQSKVSVLLNLGKGTFAAPVGYAAG